MSFRPASKADRRKGDSRQRNLPLQNVTQKPLTFHNVLKPNLPLSDEREFPSLNEISRKVPHNSHTSEEFLKYSDKLKLRSTVENQSSVSSFIHLKNNPVLTDSHKNSSCNHGSESSNKWFRNRTKHNSNEKQNCQTSHQNQTNEVSFENKKLVNSSQNIPKENAKLSLREFRSSKYNENKGQSPKQKHATNPSNSLSRSTHKVTDVVNSNCSSHYSQSNNQTESRNEQQTNLGNSPAKEGNDASGNSTAKKKKKRKSKVKRQVALQTGKITVLTPEVHSKILNQTSALTHQNFKSILTDINDEEEYPELGKSLIPSSQKENYLKESNTQTIHEAVDKSTDTSSDMILLSKDITVKDSPVKTNLKSDDKSSLEKKGKGEGKPVHVNDPITVSFFDILVNKNLKTKVKTVKTEDDTSPTIDLVKTKIKNNSSHPHNFLDSSAPTIKRGKEREKPKAKKPSHLKKIILLDRKVRKEQLLQLKGNSFEEENAVPDNECKKVDESEENEVNSSEKIILLDKNYENISSNSLQFQLELQEGNDHFPDIEDCSLCLPDDAKSPTEFQNNSAMNEIQKSESVTNVVSVTVPAEEVKTNPVSDKTSIDTLKSESTANISSVIIPAEEVKMDPISDKSSTGSHLDKVTISEKVDLPHSGITSDSSLLEKSNIGVSRSDLLLETLKNHDKRLNSSDREKAVKILLHTRHFREYCNHLISKDIDDVVLALLDDLARFQDRLHQKDPVKARMKRRMIYGVKEVKKHIKLKKLKSIVIAADIENVEAQGGLNDFLNDIKSLATDHHIPCVFALSRKVLGKVCRKPVPVSCVGVFNYEGSEVNFKKMVELQTQSKIDYIEIYSKLSESLTEDQIASLLKAKKEAPEALSSIRRNILADFFVESKAAIAEEEQADLKSDKASNSSDTEV